MICDNLDITADGILSFAGQNTVELAKKYGTPLYLMDEEKIRQNCRTYVNSMKKYFGDDSLPLYASKAASFKQIYRIVNEEGMGVDVVSAGELYTATQAGFPAEKIYFHGSNKTDFEIEYAIDCKIGYFIADSIEEISAIDLIAKDKGVCQKILLRITPGIDPHTYEAVATGKVDSKFGFAIETNAAETAVKYALEKQNIKLCGFHCHVGSQVFDSDVYFMTSDVMLDFAFDMKNKYGLNTEILNLGGGYGVRYIDGDPIIDIEDNISQVAQRIKSKCRELEIKVPSIRLEPGRSIVADAGLTLYEVGAVKKIPSYKNYVSVDGGMCDNPRYALYGSLYTVVLANKMNENKNLVCTVAGRCCESGDVIQENVLLPESVTRGDIVAVLTTGAYNYSMASNYNRVPKPPIVMLNDNKNYVAVKREDFFDITKNDI
jgi:diaminopimelate decarboxylase